MQAENDLRGDSSRGGRFKKDMEGAEKKYRASHMVGHWLVRLSLE